MSEDCPKHQTTDLSSSMSKLLQSPLLTTMTKNPYSNNSSTPRNTAIHTSNSTMYSSQATPVQSPTLKFPNADGNGLMTPNKSLNGHTNMAHRQLKIISLTGTFYTLDKHKRHRGRNHHFLSYHSTTTRAHSQILYSTVNFSTRNWDPTANISSYFLMRSSKSSPHSQLRDITQNHIIAKASASGKKSPPHLHQIDTLGATMYPCYALTDTTSMTQRSTLWMIACTYTIRWQPYAPNLECR
jgi:hypothetical protein